MRHPFFMLPASMRSIRTMTPAASLYRLLPGRPAGLLLERLFWSQWLKRALRCGHPLLTDALDPDLPLSGYHRQFIDDVPRQCVRILDVGAGPLTVLGKTHPTKTIEITAVDLLAPSYDRLLARHGIRPPVRTIFADAEALSRFVAANHFDLVNAQNAIDHCRDPRTALAEMVAVAKPGGYVSLIHRENEAEKARYSGLHQWNFTLRNDALIAWNRHGEQNLTAALSAEAEVSNVLEDGVVRTQIRKHALRQNTGSAGCPMAMQAPAIR